MSGRLERAPERAVREQIQSIIRPPDVNAVIAVQVGGDVLTLAILWYLALSERRPS